MKKMLCVLLAAFALLLFACGQQGQGMEGAEDSNTIEYPTTPVEWNTVATESTEEYTYPAYTYPIEAPSEVKRNADFLCENLGIDKVAAFNTAHRLDSLGIREIIGMQSEPSENKGYHVYIRPLAKLN